jgi:hypothetical protein
MAKSLTCLNCNALLPFPEGALLVRCDYCGATCDLRTTQPPPAAVSRPAAEPAAKRSPQRDEVADLHAQIRENPFKVELYKALRKVYLDRGQLDAAWCLSATLVFLKSADPEEQQFHAQHRARGFVRAKARMTDEMWNRYVFHPGEGRRVNAILALIAPVVAPMTAHPHKACGLKRKKRRDLATDDALLTKVLNYCVSVLNVGSPELYVNKKQSGLLVVHTEEVPSFVAGPDLLEGRPDKELAFILAKSLSYLRPEHFLRRVMTAPTQLRTVFFAALRLTDPKYPVPPAGVPEVNKILRYASSRLPSGMPEQLRAAVRKFVESGAEPHLNKWWSSTELSANRIGFVLCNDLELATTVVSAETAEVGSLPPKERVKELVAYSVSQEYFQLRDQLGLCIGQ